MHTLFLILGLWVGVNLLHTLWVETRRHFWEKRIKRSDDGLLPDSAAYTVGNGPVAILFIHGFADTPFIWKRMAERLAATQAFTCRAMRLPGSAETAKQAKHQSLDLWRQAVDKELANLRTTHTTVWVVGHSLGGALALDTALRTPDKIDGIAAFAPMIEVSHKRSPLLPPDVWFRIGGVTLCLSPTFVSPFSSDSVAKDDPTLIHTRDRFIPFCVYRGLFELIRANRDRALHLACPLFAATAERDSVVDTPAAQRWFAACPSPKEIRTLADIGHEIPHEIGWQPLTDSLASFIRNNSQGKNPCV